MWAAEIKRKATQSWHISAAVLLHAALGMVIFSYKPSARTVELVTPIDLSLFTIEPSPPAAPNPLSTDEPDQTSEQTDLPTPAPIGSQDVDVSPPSRLVAPNEMASGNSPIDRDTALSKPPDSVGRPEIPQGWIIEDNDVWFGVPETTATEETNALRALSCLRLGRERESDPRCGSPTNSALPEGLQIARSDDLIGPTINDNPFASALDLFSDSQYADRTTTYSTFSQRTSDHQHAQPMFSYRSSAERDLTGNLNSAPHPGD